MGLFSRRADDEMDDTSTESSPLPVPLATPTPWPPASTLVSAGLGLKYGNVIIGTGLGHIAATITDEYGAPVSTREESVPVIGWKHAQVMTGRGRVMFAGYHGDYDGGPQQARCGRHVDDPPHESPHVGCMCGWNAYRSMELARDYGGYSGHMLEVELWGRVHVYKRGYRASHQRVLALHLPFCMCGEESLRLTHDGRAACLSHVGDPTFATGFGELRQRLGPIALVVNEEISDLGYPSLGS